MYFECCTVGGCVNKVDKYDGIYCRIGINCDIFVVLPEVPIQVPVVDFCGECDGRLHYR